MLVQQEKVNMQDFLAEFSKRFSNFCQKAPLLLSFKTTVKGVSILNHSTQKYIHFDFDLTKTVKENIHAIKSVLVDEEYPVMHQTDKTYMEYTTDELQEKIEAGQSADNVLFSKKEILKRTTWRIERVIVRRDEFFVRNLNSGELFRFKTDRMPCTLFLKRMREKNDPVTAWETFNSVSTCIGKVEEADN